jgi:hypothetical protein
MVAQLRAMALDCPHPRDGTITTKPRNRLGDSLECLHNLLQVVRGKENTCQLKTLFSGAELPSAGCMRSRHSIVRSARSELHAVAFRRRDARSFARACATTATVI